MASIRYQNVNRFGKSILATLAKRNAAKGAIAAAVGAADKKEKELVSALKTMLGIKAKVRIVSPRTLTRSEGKSKRVIDKRNLN